MMNEKIGALATYQEGGKCPECGGALFYPPVEDCYCHISPPCAACTNNPLRCPDCGFEWRPGDEKPSSRPALNARAHPEYAPTAVTGRAPETEVIYAKPTYCCGQNYTYEAMSGFYCAQYGFPYTIYSMDDFGDLFTSSRHNLYAVNAKSYPHSTCSMRISGWYPPHLTREDVRAVVNGTFGGRFESFHNGQFSFIAYTD